MDRLSLGSSTDPDFAFQYISLADVETGRIAGSLKSYRFADAPSRARRVINKGDILISTVRPNLLGFALVEDDHKDCIASTGFAVVSPRESVDRTYLFQCLFGPQLKVQFDRLVVGSSYPAINSNDVKNLRFKIPPLHIQRKIGEGLRTWDKAIEKLEALLTAKRQVRNAKLSVILENQSWPMVSLADLGHVTSAGVDKKTVEGETPVRLVNFLDVFERDFLYDVEIKHTVTAPTRQVESSNVCKGDVFFTPSSETQEDLAQSAIAMEDMPGAVYSYHVVRLRFVKEIELLFRAYLFKSQHFRKQAFRLCAGSGQRYVISQGQFRRMTVRVPPIEQQKVIGNYLWTLDRETALINREIKSLVHQKRGLLQDALKVCGG